MFRYNLINKSGLNFERIVAIIRQNKTVFYKQFSVAVRAIVYKYLVTFLESCFGINLITLLNFRKTCLNLKNQDCNCRSGDRCTLCVPIFSISEGFHSLLIVDRVKSITCTLQEWFKRSNNGAREQDISSC